MNPFSGHNYIGGIVLMAIGVIGAIASIEGQLAPCIAALFAPEYLGAPSNSSQSQNGGVVTTTNDISKVINELDPLTDPLGPIEALKSLIP